MPWGRVGANRRRGKGFQPGPYPRSASCCPRRRTRPAALPVPSSRCAAGPDGARGCCGCGCCLPAAPCAHSARQPSHSDKRQQQRCAQSRRRRPMLRLSRRGAPVGPAPAPLRLPSAGQSLCWKIQNPPCAPPSLPSEAPRCSHPPLCGEGRKRGE